MTTLFPLEAQAEVAAPAPGELLFSLFVPGKPSPAGSKKAVPVWSKRTGTYAKAANGRPIVAVMDDAKNSRAWKERISALAVDAWKSVPLDEPLSLSMAFTMPRPGSHYGRCKGVRVLKTSAPRWHVGKPDALKLARAAEDALSGIVFVDDSRVAEIGSRKGYGEVPGVLIEIRRAP